MKISVINRNLNILGPPNFSIMTYIKGIWRIPHFHNVHNYFIFSNYLIIFIIISHQSRNIEILLVLDLQMSSYIKRLKIHQMK